MSDDLTDQLDFCSRIHRAMGYPENAKLFAQSATRIRDLEGRLATARGDALKAAAQWHDDRRTAIEHAAAGPTMPAEIHRASAAAILNL